MERESRGKSEGGKNSIILPEGSQASPFRPSDEESVKAKNG
jgi:hypothetical protein